MNPTAFTDHLPGRTVLINGAEYLYFSGTSYLGMACNEAFQKLLQEGMRRYGTNYSSSRRSNLQLQVYEQAEEQLTRLTGAEAAVTMSSGFLVGQTLVQALSSHGRFLYAPCAHPALWLNSEVAAAANAETCFETWAAQVVETVQQSHESSFVIVCNALDPLQAKAYTFDWIEELPSHKNVILVVDDSHGFGVRGAEGAGIYQQLSKYKHVELVIVSSMGKALGIPAGIILGPKWLIEQVKASAYFGGASPAIPAYLYAYLRAGAIYKEARKVMQENIELFRQQVRQPYLFQVIPGYPVFSTKQQSLTAYLEQQRIIISSFCYPTAESAPVTRVILSSLHTAADVQRLTEAINKFEPEHIPENV
ncbi:aminotransferase class I/II-fold pyridoxal phosphate-dependent enzyme [Pontibacter akesuensis]|uniref:7-keto-8-aminopelargonate synthetase n=1 Tax=Pontibacter akesuensis TaxID=388950 RepID=A0A1I7GPB8_9BACT|nr:aminotransferase class I/II-fold pyridoxal phosphate-dependent enzyme [Pontibacter akesuensis]GHA55707.1 8-amino-7-oxononanoate synthase [Pontibacter akesuensis]SFU50277.1 7-keto-8-aminopelargonate synthetase [Pontibacter akesuensis]